MTDDNPRRGLELFRGAADALDGWHAGLRRGERLPGQVRVHRPDPVTRSQAVWAEPMYRLVLDPDGRPLRHGLVPELSADRVRP